MRGDVPRRGRARWAGSGALALTGDAAGPGLVAPPGTVERIVALGAALGVDALALLVERAAVAGLSRRGAVSCGGATRLLPVGGGGWLAVSLARPDDVDLVPAWLGLAGPPADVGGGGDRGRRSLDAAALAAAGAGLGLAVGPSGPRRRRPGPGWPSRSSPSGWGRRRRSPARHWSSTCRRCGPGRCAPGCWGAGGPGRSRWRRPAGPTGAAGPPAFFDLLHAGQRSVALDFRDPAGLDRLRRLVGAADVVVEASRPRALAQLGIAAAGQPRVAVGHRARPHRRPPTASLGDDAAVAGGLVAGAGTGAPGSWPTPWPTR